VILQLFGSSLFGSVLPANHAACLWAWPENKRRRHRVPPSYTNIALMNAGDPILLGEALGQSEVADDGYARLDRVCLEIWDAPILFPSIVRK
jgi:hypothetical protein